MWPSAASHPPFPRRVLAGARCDPVCLPCQHCSSYPGVPLQTRPVQPACFSRRPSEVVLARGTQVRLKSTHRTKMTRVRHGVSFYSLNH